MRGGIAPARIVRGGVGLACISHHLTDEARDKTATTSLRLLALLKVGSSTPSRAKGLVPRPDGLLTYFASPRGGKYKPGSIWALSTLR